MRHYCLILVLLAVASTAAQPVLDLSLRRTMAEAAPMGTRAVSAVYQKEGRNVIIQKKDGTPPAVRNYTPIANGIYTACISDQELTDLATDCTIRRIAASTRHRLLTDRTREATTTDRVQTGEALDAPFTGRGVIIAMIDEGFEYRHATFSDNQGTSRIKYVWNRRIAGSEPTTEIPTGGDGYTDTGGHATHTSSIAAGASVAGSTFYGMAPDAELIFIPSNLDNAELLEDAAFVSQVARSEGKPWILNLSFGSHDGPHDGRDLYSRTMDSLLLNDGGFMVAAMGNEGGEKFHATGTLGTNNEPLRFLLTSNSSTVMLDVWAQADDSIRHATMRPFVLSDGNISYDAVDFGTAFLEELNPDNRKQHANLTISRSALYRDGGYLPVGIEVNGSEELVCHAWTDEGFGTFYNPDSRFVRGDDKYLACEGGACVPSAIAVGAYTAANTTTKLNGSTISFTTSYPLGEICPFSNSGPYLGSEPKPTIAAPGAVIRAAVSKATPEFSPRGSTLVESRTIDDETFYYGFKSGTSMSTPVVTGILALWLEACPTLSHTQLMDILRTTSQAESDTLHWGYGRIDAYAGLQAALQIAAQTGIERTMQSDFPIALQQTDDGWRILACRLLNKLSWRICDTTGRTLQTGTTTSLSQGQDILIRTNTLPKGVYILHLQTDGKAKAKKFIAGN